MIRTYPQDSLTLSLSDGGGSAVVSADGVQISIYTDAACTTLATITDLDGHEIAGSSLTVVNGALPLFSFDSETPGQLLWARAVTGGLATALSPRVDERLLSLEAEYAGIGEVIDTTVQPQLDNLAAYINGTIATQLAAQSDRITALEGALAASQNATINPARVALTSPDGRKWKVAADNAGEVHAEELPQIPVPPSNVVATVNADHTIVASFDADLGGYPADQVRHTVTAVRNTGAPTVMSGPTSPLTLGPLDPSDYTITVVSTNPAGTSAPSAPVTASIAAAPAGFVVDFSTYPAGAFPDDKGWTFAVGSTSDLSITADGYLHHPGSNVEPMHPLPKAGTTHISIETRYVVGVGSDFYIDLKGDNGELVLIDLYCPGGGPHEYISVYDYSTGSSHWAGQLASDDITATRRQYDFDLDVASGNLLTTITDLDSGSVLRSSVSTLPQQVVAEWSAATAIGFSIYGGTTPEVSRLVAS